MNRSEDAGRTVSDYREFPAPLALAEYLLCFWTQTIRSPVGFAQRVFPDCCVDILLINDVPMVVGPWTEPFVAPLPPAQISSASAAIRGLRRASSAYLLRSCAIAPCRFATYGAATRLLGLLGFLMNLVFQHACQRWRRPYATAWRTPVRPTKRQEQPSNGSLGVRMDELNN